MEEINFLYSITFDIPWYKDGNDIMRSGGIYIIRNEETSMIYVGSSKCFFKRYQRHRRPLQLNIHPNNHLQNSFNKYGEGLFTFNILEIVNNHNDIINREQHWIDLLKPYEQDVGYNVMDVAETYEYHKKNGLTKETKEKISKSLFKYYSNNISARKGSLLSKKTKNKISKSVKKLQLKGFKLPQSRVVEITDVQTGKTECFDCISDLSKKYRICSSTIRKYGDGRKLYKKKYRTRNEYIIKILELCQ